MSTLDMALLYADMGLSCFPLAHKSKRCSRGFKWTTYRERLADKSELRKWFSSGDRNIGIVTGDISGKLAVRDFDEAGAYERWRESHPDVAEILPTVKTARAYHVYARGQADKTVTFADGELRYGTYVVAPCSLHPSGVTYTWTQLPGDDIAIIDLAAAGLLTDWSACNTENSENADNSENASHSVLSVFSVLHSSIEHAIKRTKPPAPGHRERKLFELARELKAFSQLADMPVKSLKPIVQQWHKLALPYIRTKPFTESWFAFQRAWGKVKFPKGSDPISEAYAKAVESEIPADCEQYDIEGVVNLVKLCRQLQAMAGNKPFFLDCRTAGRLLGIRHVTAWRWLQGLAADGVIEVVSTGSKASRKANEYRYVGGFAR